MKIITKNKEKIVFTEEINESIANAIRRGSSEIPVLAVDQVEFYKNDSVLNDQMLAHRIGLVPLKNEKLEIQEDCTCKGEGCAKCSIQLKISAKGPKTVYAKDLKGKAEPVYEDMPIALLEDDQELEFVAHARLGKGIEHAKFSPGLVFYRHAYIIEGKYEKFREVIEKYKKDIGFIEKFDNKHIADLPEACVEELNGIEGVKTEISPNIVFIIESFGQMDAKEILLQSIDGLRASLKQVSKLNI